MERSGDDVRNGDTSGGVVRVRSVEAREEPRFDRSATQASEGERKRGSPSSAHLAGIVRRDREAEAEAEAEAERARGAVRRSPRTSRTE